MLRVIVLLCSLVFASASLVWVTVVGLAPGVDDVSQNSVDSAIIRAVTQLDPIGRLDLRTIYQVDTDTSLLRKRGLRNAEDPFNEMVGRPEVCGDDDAAEPFSVMKPGVFARLMNRDFSSSIALSEWKWIKTFKPSALKKWTIKNMGRFHVEELAYVLPKISQSLDPYYFHRELSLAWPHMRSDKKGFVWGFGPTAFAVSDRNWTYYFFSRVQLREKLAKEGFLLMPRTDSQDCIYSTNNACVQFTRDYVVKQMSWRTTLFLVGLFVVILALTFYLAKTILYERRVSEAQKLALEILVHELRTPVSTFVVETENLMSKYSQLPDDIQASALSLSGQSQRLSRLIRESENYLTQEEVALENIEVNQLVEDLIERFPDGVEFTKGSEPLELKTSSFWLRLCLKNLITNALVHGEKPVRISVERKGNDLCIHVADEGHMNQSFAQSIRRGWKSGSSEGLGLGLHIVRAAASNINGRLTYKSNPTQFTLHLRTT